MCLNIEESEEIKNYKCEIIKLDRSFFYGKNGFTDSSKKAVKSIIDLAYKLHKAVVAEEKRKLRLILEGCQM